MIVKLESRRGFYYQTNRMLGHSYWQAHWTLGGFAITTPAFYLFVRIPFKGNKMKRLNAERRARLRASR